MGDASNTYKSLPTLEEERSDDLSNFLGTSSTPVASDMPPTSFQSQSEVRTPQNFLKARQIPARSGIYDVDDNDPLESGTPKKTNSPDPQLDLSALWLQQAGAARRKRPDQPRGRFSAPPRSRFSGNSGGFERTVSAKKRNFSCNFIRQTSSMFRFSRNSSKKEDSLAEIQELGRNIYRGYSVGDSILISDVNARWQNCVNRLGFPPGEGKDSEEQRGPFSYVLGKVKVVHYEENEVFYTVKREDTGEDVRGDAIFMAPISSKRAEEAARRAATQTALEPFVDQNEDQRKGESSTQQGEKTMRAVENICVILVLPLYYIYDCFGARLFRWLERLFASFTNQASLFLNGMKPYHCSTRITTVNLVVLCSTWYMFIDQARLAFFPAQADGHLAKVNLVVWTILLLELLFEVFIRPDGYRKLIRSDKAFTPTTVRYISGLHLFVEFISLVIFVPEFLCLFDVSDMTCDGRITFSFLNSTLLAITGPSRRQALAGRALHACVRLRVFSLVRHWKNMWINRTFLRRQKKKMEEYVRKMQLDKTEKQLFEDGEIKDGLRAVTRVKLLQKQRDVAFINASSIRTALMATNSYRALFILCAILGLFPMITLICDRGVIDSVTIDMIKNLQATNLQVDVENDSNCQYLVGSLESWMKSFDRKERGLITSDTDNFIVGMVIQPSRCTEYFQDYHNLTFREMSCEKVDYLDMELDSGNCIVATLNGATGSLEKQAKELQLRLGNLETKISNKKQQNLTRADESFEEVTYLVAAHFNRTFATENSALSSFLLQICLLATVLSGLSILRHDTENTVLGPLRSMLKIVARYAKNPLAQATLSKRDNLSEVSDSESEFSMNENDDDNSHDDDFGTYETEQLITAVAKITDLLRKCWGVAGADIISTNLSSREGALAEVFNPTVPGKSVYALFAFAAINGFDHALKCLGGDVMILINDVAAVVHKEVFRWGFGDSGQCNKNLGATFLMVFRIGLVKEVIQKLEEATKVVFSTSDAKKLTAKKRSKAGLSNQSKYSAHRVSTTLRSIHGDTKSNYYTTKHDKMVNPMELSLQSLPGISTFTDRAVIGMLKSFAGIHRDNKLRGWSRDFRLSAGVGTFSVNMIFGMDAGWAVEGAVGSEYKIDATYLSPHVNMASRMMSACKHYGVTILLSEGVQALMSDEARSKLRNIDKVTVKGSTRIQSVYTYDARYKGADFFLFGRSDDQADIEAERYAPGMWNTDQDLKAMRRHITEDFEEKFNDGMKAYFSGDWPSAIEQFEQANEIMVDAAMEEGYLDDELDEALDLKELYRSKTADGPSTYLVNFMKSQGGQSPERWEGWHPLLSK